VTHLRPEFVKLDRSIVSGFEADPAKRAVVRSMLAMSDELGAVLVAEGVENQDEIAALHAIGVRIAQGYALGVPDTSIVFQTAAGSPMAPALAQVAAALESSG
jgi:EAL domain-containing protein (putative c-di-GMP-specific phosphodiesterase class I)